VHVIEGVADGSFGTAVIAKRPSPQLLAKTPRTAKNAKKTEPPDKLSDLRLGPGFHFGLDAVVNLIPDQASNEASQLGILHELDGLIAIAIHPVHPKLFELGIENIGEIVQRIGFTRVANGFVG
jgi:hypothetical protein